jgi:ankyrin repeat protein
MEELLITKGAKANAPDKRGRTPIFYAFVKIGKPFECSEIDPFETVSSLCAIKDCSVKLIDEFGMSPLHYAAQRGSVISGRYLIK